MQAFNAEHGIVTQAWSPIGGITSYREGAHTSTLDDPAIVEIAESHCKSPAQVMLRWHLQEGRSVIPKSTKPRRIAENFDVFDFELSADQVAAIDGLDTGERGGPEPDAITLESWPGRSRRPDHIDQTAHRTRSPSSPDKASGSSTTRPRSPPKTSPRSSPSSSIDLRSINHGSPAAVTAILHALTGGFVGTGEPARGDLARQDQNHIRTERGGYSGSAGGLAPR